MKPKSVHAHTICQEGEAQKCACSRHWSGRGSPEVCTLTPLVRKGFFRGASRSWKHSVCLGYSGEYVLTLCSMLFTTFTATGCLTYGA